MLMSLKNGFLVHSFLKQTSSCNIPFFNIILSVLNCQYLLSFIWVPVCLWKLDLLCKMLKYNLYITAQKYNIILIIQRYKSKLVHISVSFIYFCKHIKLTRILLGFFSSIVVVLQTSTQTFYSSIRICWLNRVVHKQRTHQHNLLTPCLPEPYDS